MPISSYCLPMSCAGRQPAVKSCRAASLAWPTHSEIDFALTRGLPCKWRSTPSQASGAKCFSPPFTLAVINNESISGFTSATFPLRALLNLPKNCLNNHARGDKDVHVGPLLGNGVLDLLVLREDSMSPSARHALGHQIPESVKHLHAWPSGKSPAPSWQARPCTPRARYCHPTRHKRPSSRRCLRWSSLCGQCARTPSNLHAQSPCNHTPTSQPPASDW